MVIRAEGKKTDTVNLSLALKASAQTHVLLLNPTGQTSCLFVCLLVFGHTCVKKSGVLYPVTGGVTQRRAPNMSEQ